MKCKVNITLNNKSFEFESDKLDELIEKLNKLVDLNG